MKLPSSLPITLLLTIAKFTLQGRGKVGFVDPPSGSLIANFKDTVNVSTITCNITNEQGVQQSTEWTLQNFRGSSSMLQYVPENAGLFAVSGDPGPGISYRNQLLIMNLTSELDAVMVYCGAGSHLQDANFTLRIYRPPNLRNIGRVRIEENTKDVTLDLHQDPAPFPLPTVYNWYKEGQLLSGVNITGLVLTSSSATFDIVSRAQAGNYGVSATNFDKSRQIGQDSGGFHLDVIYGPSFELDAPAQQYTQMGDSLSLICGTGLDSNPPPTISWTAPDGTPTVDNSRYRLDNGPHIVRLNFTQVFRKDIGIWMCNVTVRSEKYVVHNGGLVLETESVIGSPIHRSIELIAVFAPGKPQMLSVEDIQSTSALVHWNPPSQNDSPITYYSINIFRVGSGRVGVIVTNATTSPHNVTGLLPGTTYELTVVAVSQGGNVLAESQRSNSVTFTTKFSSPSLTCDYTTSSNGTVTFGWSYLHTGGIPLTDVSAEYAFTEGSTTRRVPVNVSSVRTSSVSIQGLTVGFKYTLNITAHNNNGASSVICGPILHVIGRPVAPTFGALMSGPNKGQVSIMIKTVASGINSTQQQFRFVVIPICDGIEERVRGFSFPNYQSGEFETVFVGELQQGKSYLFLGVAVNIFGTSRPAHSGSIILEGQQLPLSPQERAAEIIGIVGGVVGFLLLVFIILLIAVPVVLTTYRKKRTRTVTIRHGEEEQQ